MSIEAREFGVRMHGILHKKKNEQKRVWTVFETQLLKGVQTDDNKRYVKTSFYCFKLLTIYYFFSKENEDRAYAGRIIRVMAHKP